MPSSIKVITSKEEMRAFTRALKRKGKTVGFVPTMGYLHDGHLSLVEIAKRECGPSAAVVASVYVNPTQFAAHEDFDVYPRDADGDRAKLEQAGCVAVFEPASLYDYNDSAAAAGAGAAAGAAGAGAAGAGSASTAAAVDAASVVGRAPPAPGTAGMAAAHETFVTVERLQLPLCGVSRPHFFRGVATVVCKLFHVVEPDVAVFGRKDYQQLCVIARMVRDLDMAVRVVGAEISREGDGLAMSSRNARLSPEARAKAPAIHAALAWAAASAASASAAAAAAAGSSSPSYSAADVAKFAGELRDEVAARIEAAGGKVDYVEVRDARTLGGIGGGGEAGGGGGDKDGGSGKEGEGGAAAAAATNQGQGSGGGLKAVIAVAAHFAAKDRGTVRLIDNMELTIG